MESPAFMAGLSVLLFCLVGGVILRELLRHANRLKPRKGENDAD